MCFKKIFKKVVLEYAISSVDRVEQKKGVFGATEF